MVEKSALKKLVNDLVLLLKNEGTKCNFVLTLNGGSSYRAVSARTESSSFLSDFTYNEAVLRACNDGAREYRFDEESVISHEIIDKGIGKCLKVHLTAGIMQINL